MHGVAYFHKDLLLLKLQLEPHNNLQLLSTSAVIDIFLYYVCYFCVIFVFIIIIKIVAHTTCSDLC